MSADFPPYQPPADPNPLEGDDSATATPPVWTGLVLQLGDETWAHPRTLDTQPEGVFRAAKTLPRWALMTLGAAEKRNDADAQAIATHDLALASILKEDRGRFSQYMLDHDDEETFTKMVEAVGELITAWTGRPSAPSPVSSPSSPTEETPRLLRRVSFSGGSEGTTTVHPASTEKTSPAGPESWAG